MVSFFFLIWTVILLVIRLLGSFFGHINLGPFDDSLRLLQSQYILNGFSPYKDFAFIYPPGQLIINSLIKTDITSTLQLYSLIAFGIAAYLIIFTYSKTKSFFYTGVTSLLLVVNFHVLTSPFTESLWILFIFSCFYFVDGKSRHLFLITLLSSILLLLKWDRVIISVLFLVLVLFISKASFKIDSTKKLWKILKAISTSIIMSSAILWFYLTFTKSEILTAIYFIFVVPFIITPFRQLPLSLLFSHGKIAFFFLFILAFLIYWVIKQIKSHKINEMHILPIVFVLSTLPYALGRADIPHFLPFISTLIIVLVYYANRGIRIFHYLLFPSIVYVSYTFGLLSPPSFMASQATVNEITHSISSCREEVGDVEFSSIFIGRENYSHFLINYASLYLIDPGKVPATKYISDEPGLQNSCYDGQIIVNDLTTAPKPILVFVEKTAQHYEPNLSSKMSSCNKIENFLRINKYQTIGTCNIDSAKFEARLYQ